MNKLLFLALLSCACCTPSLLAQETPAQACVRDLEAVPPFLLANDTGAHDVLERKGQKYIDDALATAKAAAAKVNTDRECGEIFYKYLWTWRNGHLWYTPLTAANTTNSANTANAASSAAPAKPVPHAKLTVLSEKTLLLWLPNFEDGVRVDLEAMNKNQHETLASHPNWIIDVRDNTGGSDDSYASLTRWLNADEVASVDTGFYVTPQNIQVQAHICDEVPDDPGCPKMINPIVERMKKAKTGEYVPGSDQGPVAYAREDALEPRRPARVAVLIDHECGSSCEQFLLAVRQSFTVKLIGRRTYGVLDVSNVRPWKLPSGRRELDYATSRSLRIPAMPVDGIGVMPDIYLPLGDGPTAKDDEVKRVQNWLEGGSLAPLKK